MLRRMFLGYRGKLSCASLPILNHLFSCVSDSRIASGVAPAQSLSLGAASQHRHTQQKGRFELQLVIFAFCFRTLKVSVS